MRRSSRPHNSFNKYGVSHGGPEKNHTTMSMGFLKVQARAYLRLRAAGDQVYCIPGADKALADA